MHPRKLAISIVILLIIGLHAVPVLSYQGHRQTRWPILAWAMYARALPPGPIQTTVRYIVGVSQQGTQERVTPPLVGLSKTALRKLYLQPMWLGDSSAARQLLQRLNRDRNDPLVELRVEGEKYTLRDGVVLQEKLPVVAYRMDPSEPR
jgi:hypothetical protein